ncbi:MAG TPA: sialate O-acetylesterase [Capsulimonadaceae bacterium]|jgi:sialate O-acetylesterase
MSDLWILAGQSNMEGCGLLNDLEPSHPNVRMFAFGDKWKLADEPLHWLQQAVDRVHWWNKDDETHKEDIQNEIKNRIKGCGLGLVFAKAIHAATGVDIDLLPVAHGGTSLDQWSPEKKDLGGDGSFYYAMIRRTKLALETRPEAKLRGVLWYQGESDCNPTASRLYREKTLDLIRAIREDLQAPELPFYLVQLGCLVNPEPHAPTDVATWNIVREDERLIPSLIANTAVVPAIDFDLDDGIHISTASQKRLGQRFANIALREVYSKETPTAIDVASVRRDGATKVIVTFSGVNGTLVVPDKAGRIHGFGISTASRDHEAGFIYKAKLTGANEVTLLLNGEMAADAKIWYGFGFNPVCQLTDTADMAVPTFGPIAIA